jgi:hypothetical protein
MKSSLLTADPYAYTYHVNDHKAKSSAESTHTAIGDSSDPSNPIYGGSYSFAGEAEQTFYQMVFEKCFIHNHRNCFLTEKACAEWMDNFVCTLCEEAGKIVDMSSHQEFKVDVMQRDAPYQKKDITKDGMHILLAVRMNPEEQLHLRAQMMKACDDLWSQLPLTNTVDKVYDEALPSLQNIVQMFGCRKPHHEPYRLAAIYTACFNDQSEFDISKKDDEIKVNYSLFQELSVRLNKGVEFPLRADYLASKVKPKTKPAKATKAVNFSRAVPLDGDETETEDTDSDIAVNAVDVNDIRYVTVSRILDEINTADPAYLTDHRKWVSFIFMMRNENLSGEATVMLCRKFGTVSGKKHDAATILNIFNKPDSDEDTDDETQEKKKPKITMSSLYFWLKEVNPRSKLLEFHGEGAEHRTNWYMLTDATFAKEMRHLFFRDRLLFTGKQKSPAGLGKVRWKPKIDLNIFVTCVASS